MSLLPVMFARLHHAATPAVQPVLAGRHAYQPDRRVRWGPLLVSAGLPALMVAGLATWTLETRVVTLPPLIGSSIRVDPIDPPPPEPTKREAVAKPSPRLTTPRRPLVPAVPDAPQATLEPQPTAVPFDPGPATGVEPAAEPWDPPVPTQPVVVRATRDPRYAAAFQPDYPARELRDGVEGTVTVRVLVRPDGRVGVVELVRTDAPGFFAVTERHARARWRFRPATRDGVPVEDWHTLTVRFTIDAG